MLWPDYAILAVIAVSTLVGALRGFIKEAFSLLVWAAAFLVAYHFSGDAASLMEDTVSLPSARLAMGFTGLFVAVLLVGGLLNYLLGRLVETTGLSGTDRLLGAVFGAGRGLALVVAALLVAGFTPLPADPWWRDSPTIARLMPLVDWSAGWLPDTISGYLDFDPAAAEGETPSSEGQGSEPGEGAPDGAAASGEDGRGASAET